MGGSGLARDADAVVFQLSRVDVLIHTWQARRALRQAVTAIVEHQHLIALRRQPGSRAKVVGQVAAIAVQVQHRTLERHTFFGR